MPTPDPVSRSDGYQAPATDNDPSSTWDKKVPSSNGDVVSSNDGYLAPTTNPDPKSTAS